MLRIRLASVTASAAVAPWDHRDSGCFVGSVVGRMADDVEPREFKGSKEQKKKDWCNQRKLDGRSALAILTSVSRLFFHGTFHSLFPFRNSRSTFRRRFSR